MEHLGALLSPGSPGPAPGGILSVGSLANSSGVVAGSSLVPAADISSHAVVWAPGAEGVDITPCDHPVYSQIDDINERGQVVGYDHCDFGAYLVTPADSDGDGRPDQWFSDDDDDGRNDLEQFVGPPSCSSSFANSINEHGQIAGWGCGEAFFWDPHRGYLAIAPSSVGGNRYVHINDDGVVAGVFLLADGSSHPFVWTLATGLTDLGPMPDGSFPYARGLDDGGIVLGVASTYAFVVIPEDDDGDGRPDRWHRDTAPADGINDLLFVIGGAGSYTVPGGINDFGVVSGTAPVDEGQAFVWQAGAYLPIPPPTGGTARAYGLNDLGQVALVARDADGRRHGFLWSRALGAQPMVSPAGDETSVASVSPSGIVAGHARAADGYFYAAVWRPDPVLQSTEVAAALGRLEAQGTLSSPRARALARLITRAGVLLGAGRTAAGCALVRAFSVGVRTPMVSRSLSPVERRMLLQGVAALCPHT